MGDRGPLDGIMEQRICAELDDIAAIEFGRIAMRMPEVDFSADDRGMFMLGFAACLAAVTRDE